MHKANDVLLQVEGMRAENGATDGVERIGKIIAVVLVIPSLVVEHAYKDAYRTEPM